MSLTLANIQDRVRLYTNEPSPSSPTYATDANVLALANDACLEIASRTKTKTATSIPVSLTGTPSNTENGTRLYAIPSNILEVYKVFVNGDACSYVLFEDLWRMGGTNWWNTKGVPHFYYIEDNAGTRSIGLWETPNGVYPYYIVGVKRPTAMSTSASVPDIDERLHEAVVYKVSAQIMASRLQIEKAKYWEGLYEASIGKYLSSGMDTNESPGFLDYCPIPSD